MIDFHNHLMPGVDDGAGDLDESRKALRVLWEQGVRGVVTTPHLQGSLAGRPDEYGEYLGKLDAAWAELRSLASAEMPDLRLERGVEVMLDTPTPDVSDPRVRLAGTSFVLVEFPYMTVPPNSGATIFGMKMDGWNPVIAHPERYGGVDDALQVVEEWRRVGGLLQVNCGSLLGRYGEKQKETAWRLLRRGWVDYLSSDYHARGRCPVAEARAKLEEKGGEEQARLLMEVNPGRLLEGQPPETVPPLVRERRSLWSRILNRR